jgi:hypothetical protein
MRPIGSSDSPTHEAFIFNNLMLARNLVFSVSRDPAGNRIAETSAVTEDYFPSRFCWQYRQYAYPGMVPVVYSRALLAPGILQGNLSAPSSSFDLCTILGEPEQSQVSELTRRD